jgi:predicted permease
VTIDRWVRRGLLRLRSIFRRDVVDQELDEELQYHLDQQVAENVRHGMTPSAAREAARHAIGNVPRYKDEAREARGTRWADELSRDVRFAIRSLRRSPVFTATVVVTLALGTGANTAMFTLLRGTLLKPLPNRNGDQLLYIRQPARGLGTRNAQFSVPEIMDIRAGADALAEVADFSPSSFSILDDEGHPTVIDAGVVSGNYFDVMGLKPAAGRLTSHADDEPSSPSVTVLSHRFWMEHFGGDPDVVGRKIRLDSTLSTVIGVVQPAPQYPFPTDVLVNIVTSSHHLSAAMVTSRTHRMTEIFARLAPNHELTEARAQIERLTSNMRRDHPEAYPKKAGFDIDVTTLREAVNERAKLMFWVLMGAATFVLLVAVANVSNLTLMRGAQRQREMVVRAALGAERGRLRRLLLVENLALALVGGALGIAVSVASLKLITGFAAQLTARAAEIGIDATVLGVALATSIAAALVLSFIPRIGDHRVIGTALAPAGRRTTLGVGAKRFHRSLVVVQLAVCMVLLTGAGLLLRTLVQLESVDVGVRVENVMTLDLPPAPGSFATGPGPVIANYQRMRDRVAALPGVTFAGLGISVPLRHAGGLREVRLENQTATAATPAPQAAFRTADPGYFGAVGVPLVKGRLFEKTDDQSAPPVAIVSRSLAKRLFGSQEAIGQFISFTPTPNRPNPPTDAWRAIVGVVGDVRDAGIESDPTPAVFVPFVQSGMPFASLLVRTSSDPASLRRAVIKAIQEASPKQPLGTVTTLEEIRDETIGPRRLNALFVTSFAGLAFLIAIVGVAGVLAASVRSRTNEFGIRMSLGAGPERLRRLVLGEGGLLILLGIGVGSAGSFFAARALQSLLFGVAVHDPVTFVGAAALLAGVGVAACLGPAKRAARVDPAVALRAE